MLRADEQDGKGLFAVRPRSMAAKRGEHSNSASTLNRARIRGGVKNSTGSSSNACDCGSGVQVLLARAESFTASELSLQALRLCCECPSTKKLSSLPAANAVLSLLLLLLLLLAELQR